MNALTTLAVGTKLCTNSAPERSLFSRWDRFAPTGLVQSTKILPSSTALTLAKAASLAARGVAKNTTAASPTASIGDLTAKLGHHNNTVPQLI